MNVKEYGKVKFKKAAGIVNMYNLQHSKVATKNFCNILTINRPVSLQLTGR